MGEHPTINIGEEELELIELHRTKTALMEKQKSLQNDLEIIDHEGAEMHAKRELNIVNGALESINKIFLRYEEKYGKQEVKAMVT